MGLKRTSEILTLTEQSLQTNPCGVEAFRPAANDAASPRYRRTLVGLKRVDVADPGLLDRLLQTNPCGVEAVAVPLRPREAHDGYRRTLVGLKHVRRDTLYYTFELQTNPCGVEALSGQVSASTESYRRTLVGLKPSSSYLWRKISG